MSEAEGKPASSATSRAHDFVRAQIVTGAYAPGSMISESDIALAIGVSRTPVREAFQVLAREGWLRIYPKRGALIAPVSVSDVADLYEIRKVLETWVVRKVMSRPIGDELAARLRAAVDEHRAQVDGELTEFGRAAQALHQLLVEATDNALLLDLFDWLRGRQMRVGAGRVRSAPTREDRLRSVVEHEALVEALLAGDAEKAQGVMASHIDHMMDARREPLD